MYTITRRYLTHCLITALTVECHSWRVWADVQTGQQRHGGFPICDLFLKIGKLGCFHFLYKQNKQIERLQVKQSRKCIISKKPNCIDEYNLALWQYCLNTIPIKTFGQLEHTLCICCGNLQGQCFCPQGQVFWETETVSRIFQNTVETRFTTYMAHAIAFATFPVARTSAGSSDTTAHTVTTIVSRALHTQ